MFAKHDPAAKADAPVTMVSYNEARSYVSTRGGRLLTGEEWDAAARTPSFSATEGILEWVDSPGDRKAVRQRGVSEIRADAKHRDVTFRLARDL
jgi:formylglycine-generating enzyme required for sulfatase activity